MKVKKVIERLKELEHQDTHVDVSFETEDNEYVPVAQGLAEW